MSGPSTRLVASRADVRVLWSCWPHICFSFPQNGRSMWQAQRTAQLSGLSGSAESNLDTCNQESR